VRPLSPPLEPLDEPALDPPLLDPLPPDELLELLAASPPEYPRGDTVPRLLLERVEVPPLASPPPFGVATPPRRSTSV
jgi:hypothetical protein